MLAHRVPPQQRKGKLVFCEALRMEGWELSCLLSAWGWGLGLPGAELAARVGNGIREAAGHGVAGRAWGGGRADELVKQVESDNQGCAAVPDPAS